jgi:NitT/TauT family transport system ATP-binding protein
VPPAGSLIFRTSGSPTTRNCWQKNQFAVEAIDLKVRKGEFIAIVGPSGCGKSTFMKLATGLKMPSMGKILIDGKPVTGPLKISGMAFQAPVAAALAHDGGQRAAAAGDRRALPQQLQAKAQGVRAARPQAAAKGRPGRLRGQVPWQLSGGMQQRASICRALIHEPKMLLLDEPFGALDAFTREELWCILRDLWTEQQFNVILVTHDLRESVFLADTVYVMSKSPGRFVVRREIDLPRPRDLEITYTPEFTDIVHELRGHIGAMRKAGRGTINREPWHEQKQVERWSPWLLLVAVIALWQIMCSVPSTSRSSSFPARCDLEPVLGIHRGRLPATPGAPSGSRWWASACHRGGRAAGLS